MKDNMDVKNISGYAVGNKLGFSHFPVEEECPSSSQGNG